MDTGGNSILKHYVFPVTTFICLPIFCQTLLAIGKSSPHKYADLNFQELIIGNGFAWGFIGTVVTWALLWFVLSSDKKGPRTSFGVTPIYKKHGVAYYLATAVCTLLVFLCWPDIPKRIYFNFGAIIAGFHALGLGLTIYMFFQAKQKSPTKELDPYLITSKGRFPTVYEFFRGMELHPILINGDLKQFIEFRMGMMIWQIFILAFFIHAWDVHGQLDMGHCGSFFLQSLYIMNLFFSESNFPSMLDGSTDRAGYYIICGTLTYYPVVCTWQSYLFVGTKTKLNWVHVLALVLIALGVTWVRFAVTAQKLRFRREIDKGIIPVIWGTPAESLTFEKETGRVSHLLLSGWWGVARRMSYTFEMGLALIWCLLGWQLGPLEFVYLGHVLAFLIHRIYRDEEKCRRKYGKVWELYCSKVPYRLVPFVF